MPAMSSCDQLLTVVGNDVVGFGETDPGKCAIRRLRSDQRFAGKPFIRILCRVTTLKWPTQFSRELMAATAILAASAGA